jgi:hypothetical protein
MQGGSPESMFFISTAGETPRFFSSSDDVGGHLTPFENAQTFTS